MFPSETNPEPKAIDPQNDSQDVSEDALESIPETPGNVDGANLEVSETLKTKDNMPSEEEIAGAFTGESISKAGVTDENNQPENKTKKKLSRKTKITLLVVGWIVLLGIGIGAAFLLKPAPEIVHTDAIIEAYKFSESNTEKTIETVDDLDYYGYYTPNPLIFKKLSDGQHDGVYVISGLKDKSIEEKINSQIKEAADRLSDIMPERRSNVYMTITANYYNILSFYLSQYNYETWDYDYEYFVFDLNTGNELSFDDLFPSNINLSSLLYKSFYDKLSTNIQLKKLDLQRRLNAESDFPDPSQCMAEYCPNSGETYDSIRGQIANYDAEMANIEEAVANSIQLYLSGDKRFYLNSYGPTFILADGNAVDMKLEDNIRYAIYLKRFRSSNSIFDSGISPESNPFFTETPDPDVVYINEETETYLFDYAEGYSEDISSSIRQSFREQVKNKGLSVPGDASKFRHILASSNIHNRDNVRIGYIELCVYETDKSYYNSTYKKAVIDGKAQHAWISGYQQPARSGHYDTDNVTPLSIDGKNAGCQILYPAVTDSGELLENVDEILINPSDSDLGWEDYLKQVFYNQICVRTWADRKCYSDEEKQSQELLYSLGYGDITISIKDNSESSSTDSYRSFVRLSEIPTRYFNPAIIAN